MTGLTQVGGVVVVGRQLAPVDVDTDESQGQVQRHGLSGRLAWRTTFRVKAVIQFAWSLVDDMPWRGASLV